MTNNNEDLLGNIAYDSGFSDAINQYPRESDNLRYRQGYNAGTRAYNRGERPAIRRHV